MSLVGRKIKHKWYGKGVIKEIIPGKAIVEFEAPSIGEQTLELKVIKNTKWVKIYDEELILPPGKFDRSKEPLTVVNLAELGFLDDFYDFYCELLKYNEQIMESVDQEGSYGVYTQFVRLIDINVVKRIGAPFFKKYSFLFIDQPFLIEPKYDTYAKSLYLYTPSKELYGKPVRMKFTTFLHDLSWAIFYELRDLPKTIYSYINVDEARKRFNNHIFDEFEKYVTSSAEEAINIRDLESPLYIFTWLSNTTCKRQNHSVSATKVYVPNLNDLKKTILPVHYCEDCQRYMIGRATLAQYDKKYKKILARRIKMSDSDNAFSDFAIESKLHQYGYNVVDGELTDDERHELLEKLIKEELMTYFEIASIIGQNINFFDGRPNYALAVKKWNDDLLYLGEYILRKFPNK